MVNYSNYYFSNTTISRQNTRNQFEKLLNIIHLHFMLILPILAVNKIKEQHHSNNY